MGRLAALTATLTATSADGLCTWWVVRGLGGPEGVAESVDGLALEAEPDVGIYGGGDADVGVTKELLDHHELDALFEEQGRGGVPEIVKPDAAKPGSPAQRGEVPSQGRWVGG